MDFQAIHDHIISLARLAGATIMEHFDAPIEQTTKSSAVDIVTTADGATEALIVSDLLDHYPDHHIVAEEGGGQGAPADTADYYWYVDPIDGTTNFASYIPHFSTSIALTDRDLNPLVGVVYDPNRDELFSAIKGDGAWCDGEPIHVSSVTSLAESVLASGFPHDKWTNPDNNIKEWSEFVIRTRGMRRTGSAALDACYVGAGRFEGYWEKRVNAWDIAAGGLVVLEAGGKLSNYQGKTPHKYLSLREIVISNGYIHQAMVDILSGKANS